MPKKSSNQGTLFVRQDELFSRSGKAAKAAASSKPQVKNIAPTKEKYEKARKNLEASYKRGEMNKAQFEGLKKGLEKRYKNVK